MCVCASACPSSTLTSFFSLSSLHLHSPSLNLVVRFAGTVGFRVPNSAVRVLAAIWKLLRIVLSSFRVCAEFELARSCVCAQVGGTAVALRVAVFVKKLRGTAGKQNLPSRWPRSGQSEHGLGGNEIVCIARETCCTRAGAPGLARRKCCGFPPGPSTNMVTPKLIACPAVARPAAESGLCTRTSFRRTNINRSVIWWAPSESVGTLWYTNSQASVLARSRS